MDFQEKLDRAVKKNNSLLCVGLDPDPQKLKKGQNQFDFNKKIIDQTAPYVCAFKLQIAFYEAQGIKGLTDLKKTINYIRKKFPYIPIILDAKRADIGSTSELYSRAIFDWLDVEAVTVNPYLGEDALEPFFKRRERGIIILCKTSNPGASDFQDLRTGKDTLYQRVAKKVVLWNKKYKNLLMVVGATYPKELKEVRELAPNMTFLIPGIGPQGGDLKRTLQSGLRKDKKGLIINASRSIIYAQDPRSAAQKLRNEVNRHR